MLISYVIVAAAGWPGPLPTVAQVENRVSPALITELQNKRRNLFVALPEHVRGSTPDRLADIEGWSQADSHVADGRNEWFRQSAYDFFPRSLHSQEERTYSVIHNLYRLALISRTKKPDPKNQPPKFESVETLPRDTTNAILRDVHAGQLHIPPDANRLGARVIFMPGYIVKENRSKLQCTYIADPSKPSTEPGIAIGTIPQDYRLDTIREEAIKACKVRFEPSSLTLKPGFYSAGDLFTKITKGRALRSPSTTASSLGTCWSSPLPRSTATMLFAPSASPSTFTRVL